MKTQVQKQIPTDRLWQKLDSKVLYEKQPWLKLTLDTVRTDSGKIVDDFHQLHLPDFTVVIAEGEDERVLCLRSYKHGLGEVSLIFPGGMVDPGEDPLVAAKRELLEETGYRAESWHPLGSYVVHGNLGAGCGHFFYAKGAWPVQKADSGDLETMSLELKDWRRLIACQKEGEIRLLHHITAFSLALAERVQQG